MHVGIQELRTDLDASTVPEGNSVYAEVSYVLAAGDTAHNPASTKHLIYGPATVKYVEYVDGGMTAIVGD